VERHRVRRLRGVPRRHRTGRAFALRRPGPGEPSALRQSTPATRRSSPTLARPTSTAAHASSARGSTSVPTRPAAAGTASSRCPSSATTAIS
jgi:hypothetical protein